MLSARSIRRVVGIAALALATTLGACGGEEQPALVAAPDVTGKSLAEAEAALQQAGYEWTFNEVEGTIPWATASASSGTANKAVAKKVVASQDPAPGAKIADDRTDVFYLDVDGAKDQEG